MAAPSNDVRQRIEGSGHKLIDIPVEKRFDPHAVSPQLGHLQALIFDISYCVNDVARAQRLAYIRYLAPLARTTALIDGLGAHALVTSADLGLDLLIIPYAGAAQSTSVSHLLAGPQYAVFDRSYRETARRIVAPGIAKKLLVTFGGSDHTGLTLRVLSALKHHSALRFQVRVVIGRAFSAGDIATIEHSAEELGGSTLMFAPDSPVNLMEWADMAVGATGLTKYELALTGTPAVLMSIDTEHADAHLPFAQADTAVHKGVADDLERADIADAIDQLAEDTERRREMSAKGQALVDGQGANRIMNVIMMMIDA